MKRRIFCLVSFILFSMVTAYGQLPMAEGPAKERAMSDSERDLEERIAYQRFLASMAEKQRKRREPKLVLAELQEDFKQIQAVNLEMVRSLSRGGDLDFEFVADTAGEIKKRAARLKTNLVLPEPEKEEERARQEVAATQLQLKRSMLALGKLIYGVVKNPFFTEIDVINHQAGLKVRRDLDEIIHMSDWIRKSSENMKKTARKSQ